MEDGQTCRASFVWQNGEDEDEDEEDDDADDDD